MTLLLLRAACVAAARRDTTLLPDPLVPGSLSPALFVARLRPDTVVRPPAAVLLGVRFAPVPLAQLAPEAQELGTTLNAFSNAVNLLLGSLDGSASPALVRHRADAVVGALAELDAQREVLRRAAPLQADSTAPESAPAVPVETRLRSLSELERQLVLEAGFNTAEVNDLAEWLTTDHLGVRVPFESERDPIGTATRLLASTSVEGADDLAHRARRVSITPNPAALSQTSAVEIRPRNEARLAELFDASGRRVRTLSANGGVGQHVFSWDLRDERGARVAPGVYIVHLGWRAPGEGARVVVTR